MPDFFFASFIHFLYIHKSDSFSNLSLINRLYVNEYRRLVDMFARIENPFNRPDVKNNQSIVIYLDAVGNLLDLCNDKDDQVKGVCEASLVRIASRNPNELVDYVIVYKKKTQKIGDQTVAVTLRYVKKLQ